MTITVFSLDFDGCLQHEKCEDFFIEDDKDKKSEQLKELKEKNALLGDFIDRTIKKNALGKTSTLNPDPIFLIGSNRQSYDTEIANKLRTGHACFEHMKELVTHFNGKFDSFLLEDLFNDKEPGFSYKKACELLTSGSRFQAIASGEETVETLKPCPADNNKILLVFAQIQKIANQYKTLSPEEPIDYHFIDDRVDILEALHYFFTNHSFMIPTNVTLNLTHYAKGEAPTAFKTSIQGVGQIQLNFAKITQEMGAQPFKAIENTEGEIKITPQISMTRVPFTAPFLLTPLRRVRKEAPPLSEEGVTAAPN